MSVDHIHYSGIHAFQEQFQLTVRIPPDKCTLCWAGIQIAKPTDLNRKVDSNLSGIFQFQTQPVHPGLGQYVTTEYPAAKIHLICSFDFEACL